MQKPPIYPHIPFADWLDQLLLTLNHYGHHKKVERGDGGLYFDFMTGCTPDEAARQMLGLDAPPPLSTPTPDDELIVAVGFAIEQLKAIGHNAPIVAGIVDNLSKAYQQASRPHRP